MKERKKRKKERKKERERERERARKRGRERDMPPTWYLFISASFFLLRATIFLSSSSSLCFIMSVGLFSHGTEGEKIAHSTE